MKLNLKKCEVVNYSRKRLSKRKSANYKLQNTPLNKKTILVIVCGSVTISTDKSFLIGSQKMYSMYTRGPHR